MASVHWDRDTDSPTGKVDLIGSASIFKMIKGHEKTKVFLKGELLPGTKHPVHLQADNFGIHFSDLQQDCNIIVDYILNHEPPQLDDYPNPYTRETYRTLFPNNYNIDND